MAPSRPETTQLQSLALSVNRLGAAESTQLAAERASLAATGRVTLISLILYEDSLRSYVAFLDALGHPSHEGQILTGQECNALVRHQFRDVDDSRILRLLLSPRTLTQLRRFVILAAPEEWHEALVWISTDSELPRRREKLPTEGFYERLRQALKSSPNAAEHFPSPSTGSFLFWTITIPHTRISATHGVPPASGVATVKMWWHPDHNRLIVRTGGLFCVVDQSICEAWLHRKGSRFPNSICDKAVNLDVPFVVEPDDALPPNEGDVLKLRYGRGDYRPTGPVVWEASVTLGTPETPR